MRITVIAATGGVGRQLVAQALAAGHDLTAVVRDPTRLPPDVRAVCADLAAPAGPALEDAVRGADAVLSCLGARSSQDIGIACRGTSAVVSAMEAVGTTRLVVISAAPVATLASPGRPDPPRRDPGDGPLVRYFLGPVIKRVFRRVYDDLARMEDIVRASALQWTILRPPRLTDRPSPTEYRLAYGQNVRGLAVSRPAVAHAMLTVIDDPAALRQAAGLAR